MKRIFTILCALALAVRLDLIDTTWTLVWSSRRMPT